MFNFYPTYFARAIATLAITSLSILAQPAQANLFVSPMYLRLESEQGQSKGVIQIGNSSSKPIRVSLSATAFTYNQNGAFQRLDPQKQAKQDLTPYLRYSPREMEIPANSSRRVRLISLLPPSLPDGEYRTAIFAETLQSRTNSQGHKVGFNLSIGSALYVAKGELEPDVAVVESDFDRTNKKLKIMVANDGTATAKGKINWVLKQGEKTIVRGQSGGAFLPASQTNVILNSDRQAEKLDLPQGNYQLEGEIVWDSFDRQSKSKFNLDLQL